MKYGWPIPIHYYMCPYKPQNISYKNYIKTTFDLQIYPRRDPQLKLQENSIKLVKPQISCVLHKSLILQVICLGTSMANL